MGFSFIRVYIDTHVQILAYSLENIYKITSNREREVSGALSKSLTRVPGEKGEWDND